MWIKIKPREFLAFAVAAVLLSGISDVAINNIHKTTAWDRIFTNGHYIGLVPQQTAIETSMQRIATGYHVQLELSSVHFAVPANYSWQPVTTLPTVATAISVDHHPIVYTASADDAEKVLHDVKAAYLPKSAPASSTDIHFLGNVSLSSVIVSVADILDTSDATRLLLHPKAGTLSARSEGIRSLLPKQSQIQGPLAPTGTSLQPSQTPSGEDHSALLQVEVKTTQVTKVPMPYQTRYLKDSQLGVGSTSIIQHGKPGLARQWIESTFVNGALTHRAVLKQDVLKSATTEVAELGTNNGVAAGTWGWPTTYTDITSPFGPRVLNGVPGFHPGVDIGCPIGTPIYATNNGVVEQAGWNSGGYGNWVLIDNGNGIETVFGHMSHVVAHEGETVTKGTLIGYSGDTGDATGPHLHYEVRKDGTAISPGPYM